MTTKLSNDTLNVLKKLHSIDQSLRIVAETVETKTDADGNEKVVTILRTKSQNKTMMARVEIVEEFPRDVNIYDLREFISVVNLVDDPELDFSNDKFIQINSVDGKQKLRYLEANPDLITSYIAKDLKLGTEDIKLTVTEDQLKSVLTAASTLKL